MNDNEKNTNLAYSMSILYEDDGSERTWTIYGIPRTKKNSPMIAGTGRKCPVCGKPAKQWVRQGDVYTNYAALALMQLEPKPTKPIDYPVNVRCVFYLNTRRRIDKSNLEAAAHDLLVEAEILADDNRDIIATTDGSCVLYDREKPRTEITITPLKNYEQWRKEK